MTGIEPRSQVHVIRGTGIICTVPVLSVIDGVATVIVPHAGVATFNATTGDLIAASGAPELYPGSVRIVDRGAFAYGLVAPSFASVPGFGGGH